MQKLPDPEKLRTTTRREGGTWHVPCCSALALQAHARQGLGLLTALSLEPKVTAHTPYLRPVPSLVIPSKGQRQSLSHTVQRLEGLPEQSPCVFWGQGA